MFPAPFPKIAAKEHRSVTHSQQLLMVHLWPLIITVVLLMTVSSTGGDPGSECPARCSCSTLDSYVNSREVKCCLLNLSDIPAILNLATVHTLDLSENEISILRNTSFSNYSRLSTLILSSNEVEEIEINAFAGLRMMRYIDLQYNNLKSFNPEIFSSNPVLEIVSLKENALAYLSSEFPILISDSISSLDLSSCSLTTIHAVTFSRLPKLYSLDLSSNLLQTISVSIFEKLPDLGILKMNNNRWTCNCDVVEVMQWATARRDQDPAHKPVMCLENQKYRILWTAAGGSKPCSKSKTTEALLTREREFTTDMTVDLPTVSVGIPLSLKTLPHTTSRFVVTTGTSEAELRAAPWTTAGGSKPCSESKSTEALLTREREFTTDMTVDLPTVSVGIPLSLKTLPHTTSRFVVTTGTSEAELRAAPESEARGWASLSSWNMNTLMVFGILPITLGAAVFVALIAMNYTTRRLCRPQKEIQGKDNHLSNFFSDVPLLEPQLTADHRKQHRVYVSRSSDGVRYADYHVYEEIE